MFLTPRERQILVLAGRGASNREIAMVLTLSHHTVHSHLMRVLARLRARSRGHAVAIAMAEGLISAEDIINTVTRQPR